VEESQVLKLIALSSLLLYCSCPHVCLYPTIHSAETEAQMADLQEALDGVKSELAAKKREEKDGRTREAQLGTQICTVSLAPRTRMRRLGGSRR
jgi:hypothetical protein